MLFAGTAINKSHTNLLQKSIKDKNLVDKCRIIGKLKYNQLKIAYSVSDLVLSFPNRSEGFGRTISETLSLEKIILARNTGGAYDQLEKLANNLSYSSYGKYLIRLLELNIKDVLSN